MWRLTFNLLASKKVALFLFFILAVFLIPDTLKLVNTPLYRYFRFFLLLLFAINLFACSIIRFNSLKRDTLIIHLGCLLTLVGSLVGNYGYISTINVYEGDSTTSAYRWDKKEDAPLGFQITIRKINKEYYPVLLKIGVEDHGRQAALFQLKSGESFEYRGYKVTINDFDVEEESANLAIYENEKLVLHYYTKDNGNDKIQGGKFPLTFKLVAFKNPTIKKLWLDLKISQHGKTITGISAVNQPLTWNGLKIFHTATGQNPFGKPYAGLQIVRDPGIPLVYLGFITILLGCSLLLWGKSHQDVS